MDQNQQKEIALPLSDESSEEIILRIVDHIMVEKIYQIGKKQGVQTELIILISNQSTKALIELCPMLNMVFEDYPDYCYRLYHCHQVKDAIKQGNLFFYQACTPENQLYGNPASDFKLYAEMPGVSQVLKKAKQNYQKEMTKIKAFNEGAAFYFERENYAQAAFMVHQQIELAYRAVELFAMGKDKITHSIRVHQKHVAPYVPELGFLFDEGNESENKLMKQLDDAYLAVRYENDYLINKDKLIKAIDKGILAQELVTQIYENTLESFEQQHLQTERTVESKQPIITNKPDVIDISNNWSQQDDIIDLVIKRITVSIDVECLYCFSRQEFVLNRDSLFLPEASTTHHKHDHLLVVTTTEVENQGTIQSLVDGIPELKDRVTILTHAVDNVQKSLNHGNRFFYHVLSEGDMVYTKSLDEGAHRFSFKLFEDSFNQKSEYAGASLYWRHCIHRAEAFYEAGSGAWDQGSEQVAVSLFAQAIEQVCLGSINVFLGYRPQRHALSHLFDLCCVFTHDFEEIIPRWYKEDQVVFKILSESVSDVRYRRGSTIDPTDVGVLHRRCKQFLEQAEKICKAEIERLKCSVAPVVEYVQ